LQITPKLGPAVGICEAVKRPSMGFVPVKTIEQQSALLMHRARDLLIRQRTMLVNTLRGHMAEFGLVEAQGLHKVAGLITIVMDESDRRIPDMARQVLKMITDQISDLQTRISALEAQVLAWHRDNPVSQRPATIPGDWADHRHCDCSDSRSGGRVPQRPGICRLARAGAEPKLNRW
jgi:transposase